MPNIDHITNKPAGGPSRGALGVKPTTLNATTTPKQSSPEEHRVLSHHTRRLQEETAFLTAPRRASKDRDAALAKGSMATDAKATAQPTRQPPVSVRSTTTPIDAPYAMCSTSAPPSKAGSSSVGTTRSTNATSKASTTSTSPTTASLASHSSRSKYQTGVSLLEPKRGDYETPPVKSTAIRAVPTASSSSPKTARTTTSSTHRPSPSASSMAKPPLSQPTPLPRGSATTSTASKPQAPANSTTAEHSQAHARSTSGRKYHEGPSVEADRVHVAETMDRLRLKASQVAETLHNRKPFVLEDATRKAEISVAKAEPKPTVASKPMSTASRAAAAWLASSTAKDVQATPKKVSDTTLRPARVVTTETQSPRPTAQTTPGSTQASPSAPSRQTRVAAPPPPAGKQVEPAHASTAKATVPSTRAKEPIKPLDAREVATPSSQTRPSKSQTTSATAAADRARPAHATEVRLGTPGPQAKLSVASTATPNITPSPLARDPEAQQPPHIRWKPVKAPSVQAVEPTPATETRPKHASAETVNATPSLRPAAKAEAIIAPPQATATPATTAMVQAEASARIQRAHRKADADPPPSVSTPARSRHDVNPSATPSRSSHTQAHARPSDAASSGRAKRNGDDGPPTSKPVDKGKAPLTLREPSKTTASKPTKHTELANPVSLFLTRSLLPKDSTPAPSLADSSRATKDAANNTLRIDSARANDRHDDGLRGQPSPRTPKAFKEYSSTGPMSEAIKLSPQMRRIYTGAPPEDEPSTHSVSSKSSAHTSNSASGRSHHVTASSSSHSRAHLVDHSQMSMSSTASHMSTHSGPSKEPRGVLCPSTPQTGSFSTSHSTHKPRSPKAEVARHRAEAPEQTQSSAAVTSSLRPIPGRSHHDAGNKAHVSHAAARKVDTAKDEVGEKSRTLRRATPLPQPTPRPDHHDVDVKVTATPTNSGPATRSVGTPNTEVSPRAGKSSSLDSGRPSMADAACASSGVPMREVARHLVRVSKADTVISDVASIDYVPPPLPVLDGTFFSSNAAPSSSKGKARASSLHPSRSSRASSEGGSFLTALSELARPDIVARTPSDTTISAILDAPVPVDAVSLRSESTQLTTAFGDVTYSDNEYDEEEEEDDLVYHSHPAYLTLQVPIKPLPQAPSRTSTILAAESLAKLDESLNRLQHFAAPRTTPHPLKSAMKTRADLVSCALGESYALVNAADAAEREENIAGPSSSRAVRFNVNFPSGSTSTSQTATPIETHAGPSSAAASSSTETRVSRGVVVPVDFPPRYSTLSPLRAPLPGSPAALAMRRPGRERSQSDVTEHRQSQLRHARSVPFLCRTTPKLQQLKESRRPGELYANSLGSRSAASLGTLGSRRRRAFVTDDPRPEPSVAGKLWRRAKNSLGFKGKKEERNVLGAAPFANLAPMPFPSRPRPDWIPKEKHLYTMV